MPRPANQWRAPPFGVGGLQAQPEAAPAPGGELEDELDVLVRGPGPGVAGVDGALEEGVGELAGLVGVLTEADAAVGVEGAEDAPALARGALDEGGGPVVEPAAAHPDQEPREPLAGGQGAGADPDPGRLVPGDQLTG